MNSPISPWTETQSLPDLGQPVETLVDVILARSLEQPAQIAYTFIAADGQRASRTYQQLAQRCQAIAAVLQRLTEPGDRVLLLCPPSLAYIEAFLGCLFAGVIAVPLYPPRPNRHDQRLESIANDAGAGVMLASAELVGLQQQLSDQYPRLQSAEWIAGDLISDDLAAAWQAPAIDQSTIAFLQYTSGSTSEPKGVMVSHGNLVQNSAFIAESFQTSPADKVVTWLPPYHDMGLIGGLLQPVFAGFPAILIDPLTFLQQPIRWLELISSEQATISGGPNFAYDLCSAKATPEQLARLDLRSWRVAFNGAEPLRASTLATFQGAFAGCGFQPDAFLPCYGLAESTLLVSACPPAAPPTTLTVDPAALQSRRIEAAATGATLVSSGVFAGAQTLKIVDPETLSACADDQVGEIWLAGPSITQGYWNKAELNEQIFGARLADGEGPFFRTGDLGFIHDDQLFVTGRAKDLIIVDGRNHYPQDIELTVENAHAAIRAGGCAAFALDGDEGEVVVVVAELRRPQQAAEAAQAVRRQVQTRHDVPLHTLVWVRPGQVPKTSSGKVRRQECRARYLSGALQLMEGAE